MTIIFDTIGRVYAYQFDDDEDLGDFDDDEDLGDELQHPYNCCCEDCLQNHPERDVLYNDSQYYGDDDDEDLTDDEG